jgi:hypothetical protein
MCPALASNPTVLFRSSCAAFDHYVSHTIGDHASLQVMIEKRFMSSGTTTVHLTRRDQHANDLNNMFDFASFAVA